MEDKETPKELETKGAFVEPFYSIRMVTALHKVEAQEFDLMDHLFPVLRSLLSK